MTTLSGFEKVASSGCTLALPHAAGMQSSLPILKKNYKFNAVFFWGKLLGVKGDYLIAKGIEESYTTKKFFYWCAHLPPSRARQSAAHTARSRGCTPEAGSGSAQRQCRCGAPSSLAGASTRLSRRRPLCSRALSRSQDGVSWSQLPGVTPEMSESVAKVSTHGLQLSGDISTSLEIPADPIPEGGASPPWRPDRASPARPSLASILAPPRSSSAPCASCSLTVAWRVRAGSRAA